MNQEPTNRAHTEQEAESASQEEPRYTVVLKVGGNELDDPTFLFGLAQAVRRLQEEGKHPIIVHGGGKAIAHLQERLGLTPRFLEGLRITDEASMDVVEMVLSGLINKRIVRALVDQEIPAAGFSGVDNATVYVEKLWHPLGDLGRVGDIQDVNPQLIHALLEADIVPVISPVSFGAFDAQSYNVNADHMAAAIAARLNALQLIFVSNVPGVLVAGRVVRAITANQAESWIQEGIITGGMVPKVRSAVEAVRRGVLQSVITNLAGVQEGSGTSIIGVR